MKKIRDFSKVIGLVKRICTYSPSNEQSENKIKTFGWDRLIDTSNIGYFMARAKNAGYKVLIIQRGANR